MASMAQFLSRPAVRRLLAQHAVDPQYEKRAQNWRKASRALEPFRWIERGLYGRKIRDAQIVESPLFLLGFGRSGTTHLHNLISKDPTFGVVTNYQASFHSVALVGKKWLPRLLAGQLPATRPMDNVAIALDGPQEEEVAMVNATDHAPLHVLSFPQSIPEAYDRYVVDLGKDPEATAAWKAAYLEVLKKATLLSGGKRLALKTPP